MSFAPDAPGGYLDPWIIPVSAAYRCQACNSRTRIERDALGIVHLYVEHDDTCPPQPLKGRTP